MSLIGTSAHIGFHCLHDLIIAPHQQRCAPIEAASPEHVTADMADGARLYANQPLRGHVWTATCHQEL
ncbi:hypothetical protein L1987_83822 [Smallanthus sonchifolius]|uniref:Uncharacterized protein n=1 Tax=Smallanthus sonchifolius TaxID=185202 RepID=A0ACB8YC78_9ASTR|nr:hypothetical protein L1987_83822 [Smallanthus sonchifolius]